MSKAIKPVLIQILARKATPAPPIGSTLAPRKVKVPEFCKEFNDRSKKWPEGTPLTARVYIQKNNSFKLEISQPLTSHLLKQAAKVEKGSAEPNKKKVAYLTVSQLKSIAEEKMSDLNASSLEAAVRILSGSARSMGIDIREEG